MMSMVKAASLSRPLAGLAGWTRAGMDYGGRCEDSPGSPWENGFIESFNARLRDELLDGEIFYSLNEARIVIESWRRHYNAVRPHASLGYKPSAPEVFVPALVARAASQSRPATPPALAEAVNALTFDMAIATL
jgi:transposase InsO family protein